MLVPMILPSTLRAVGRWFRRAPDEPDRMIHAPGHQHRRPPTDDSKLSGTDVDTRRNRPWIRSSHSDSQRRRFRR
jgi:hypothetical protein